MSILDPKGREVSDPNPESDTKEAQQDPNTEDWSNTLEYREERERQVEQLDLIEIRFALMEDREFIEAWLNDQTVDKQTLKERREAWEEEIKTKLNDLEESLDKILEDRSRINEETELLFQSLFQDYLTTIKNNSFDEFIRSALKEKAEQLEDEPEIDYSEVLPTGDMRPETYHPKEIERSTAYVLSEMMQHLSQTGEEFMHELEEENDFTTIDKVFKRFIQGADTSQILESVTQSKDNPQEVFDLSDLRSYLGEELWHDFRDTIQSNPELLHMIMGKPQVYGPQDEIIAPGEHPKQKEEFDQKQREEAGFMRKNNRFVHRSIFIY
ncbi:MAG: hypothetical protein ABEJ24_01975 [Candidatus Magasanikbacteria bacterium]